MFEDTITGTLPFTPPQDLLAESKRAAKPAAVQQLRVDGWRTSWFTRISELLVGKE